MAGIDLSGARATFEELMVDTCAISKNPSNSRDATFDETTGDYVAGSDPVTSVYTGKCKVTEIQYKTGTPLEIAGAPKNIKYYRVSLPADSPEVPIGAAVGIVTSLDPQLVGRVLRVDSVVETTYRVARRLVCSRRTDALDID